MTENNEAAETPATTDVGGSELTHLLSRYIRCAFNNEREFLAKFLCARFGGWCKPEAYELECCYMASERTMVIAIDTQGKRLETTIPTMEFIDWCDAR